MTHPDPSLMVKYCQETLPQTLMKAGGMESDLAHRIGKDVLNRAEGFAALFRRRTPVAFSWLRGAVTQPATTGRTRSPDLRNAIARVGMPKRPE